MACEDQSEVVAFLADPRSHENAAAIVERIETHISRIFLVDQRAYKMKRALILPYADFSTPERRLSTCRREVELNARAAPEIYLGVRRITRKADGTLQFDGDGDLVEAVVEMKRFAQSALLDRMAQAGQLTPALMTLTAQTILRFHQGAPVVHFASGSSNMENVLDINRAGFATSDVFSRAEVEAVDAAFRARLARHAPLLDRREEAGKVRRCHGDLHLRNICLLDSGPRLFDCIEFNDAIATIDILYDLAFLLMDLWHRGLSDLANLVTNRYLDLSDEEDGFTLLPFFMAVRAAVRAHVTATQAEANASAEVASRARAYFELAHDLLRECPTRLIAIGGLSGSGKSTIAEALAPSIGAPPGARIVESDRIRKAIHGVAAETPLPDSAYQPDVSRRVYDELSRRTDRVLAEGGAVVANAVFDTRPDRERIARVARDRALPFLGVWLETDPETLLRRVEQRHGGPSDATAEVLVAQLQQLQGPIAWQTLDAGRDVQAIVAAILALPTDRSMG